MAAVSLSSESQEIDWKPAIILYSFKLAFRTSTLCMQLKRILHKLEVRKANLN